MGELYEKVKILMLKGEKGDAYDDTELRAELEAILANNAYVKYTGDGAFELPIHTINDSDKSNTSTWSSNKIVDEYPVVTYTISDNTITCDKTFAEVTALSKIPIIRILHGTERIIADNTLLNQTLGGLIIEGKTFEGKVIITHHPNDTITVVYKNEGDIRRIKFIDVETNNGSGEALFTCPSRPHLLNIVKKGTSTIEYTNGYAEIQSGTTSGFTYPKVSLVDETATTDNTYSLIVNVLEQTSGTYTVAIAY